MADPKAQAAAESVGTAPTAPAEASPLDALSPADVAKASKVGERTVTEATTSYNLVSEENATKAVQELAAAEAEQRQDPNAIVIRRAEDVRSKRVGGMSFDVGGRPDDSGEMTQAQKVAADDARLKMENPDGVVVRTAGTSGEIGGENFTPGSAK